MIEALTGPVLSSIFHLLLFILLALTIKDKFTKPQADIADTIEDVEELIIEAPPKVEEPEPEEIEPADVSPPVVTTVAVENLDTEETALEDTDDEAPSTDDSMEVEAVSDVVVSPSTFASPNVFGGRTAVRRVGAVARFGGSKKGQ